MSMRNKAAKLIAAAFLLVLSALLLASAYAQYTDPARRAGVFCDELYTALTCSGDEVACMVRFHKSLSTDLSALKNSRGSFWEAVENLELADKVYQEAKESASKSWKAGSPVAADEIDRLLDFCEYLSGSE
ncbi:hypothetical protein [Dongia sp.]|uniref:hypothetical protein n=1 Tax=Dongia sp. TaxID=1977262 RepID=UPI0035B4A802